MRVGTTCDKKAVVIIKFSATCLKKIFMRKRERERDIAFSFVKVFNASEE